MWTYLNPSEMFTKNFVFNFSRLYKEYGIFFSLYTESIKFYFKTVILTFYHAILMPFVHFGRGGETFIIYNWAIKLSNLAILFGQHSERYMLRI